MLLGITLALSKMYGAISRWINPYTWASDDLATNTFVDGNGNDIILNKREEV